MRSTKDFRTLTNQFVNMKTSILKTVSIGAIAASAALLSPAVALSPEAVTVISKDIASSKVVEVPAAVAKAIASVSKEDRSVAAVTAVTAAIKTHPSTVAATVTAAVKTAPEAVDAIVNAALEVAPNSALTIVSAAAEGAPERADQIAAVASKKMPTRSASFEREVASVRGRRLVSAGAGLTSGAVQQQALNIPPAAAPASVNSYAVSGGASGRP
jgi:hypothetical protein